MIEMAAVPPVPPPPPDGTPETFTDAPTSLLPRDIVNRALNILARYVKPPQDVELELSFDRRGNVARIALRGRKLSKIVERYAGQELAALSTNDTLVRNRRFTLKFSAAESTAL